MNTVNPGIPRIGVTELQPVTKTGGTAAQGSDFFSTLKGVMHQIDNVQADAATKVENLLRGDGEDIHSALIAVEKADLSFRLMMQVRNKIVDAYQEISRMAF